MHARHFIALCALCALTACGSGHRARTADATATAVPDAASAQEPAQTSAGTATPQPAPSNETTSESARVAPGPAPTPDALIGLAASDVDKLLGNPELVRRDGPAEVRLYRDQEQRCTFHVFLYGNDPASRSGAVEYFEARDAEGRLEGAAAADCYRALVTPAAIS